MDIRFNSLIVGTAVALLSSTSFANWSITPSVTAETSYDSNVKLEQKGSEDSGISSNAKLEARIAHSTETSNLAAIASVSFNEYSGVENVKNRASESLSAVYRRNFVNMSVGGRLSAVNDSQLNWRFIPQDPLAVDQTADQISQEDELSDIVNGVSDIERAYVQEELERTYILFDPYAQFSLNQRTNLRVGYQYNQRTYDDEDLANSLGAQDTKRHSLNAQLSRRLNERTSVAANFQAASYRPSITPDTDFYTATLSVDRALSERTSIQVNGGMNYTRPDAVGQDDDSGLQAGFFVSHRTNDGRVRAGIQKSLYPGSDGRVSDSTSLTLSYAHQISSRMTVNVGARGVRSSGGGRNDGEYVQFNPEVTYKLSETMGVSMGYQYRWRDRDTDSNDSASNSVLLSISYAPRGFYR